MKMICSSAVALVCVASLQAAVVSYGDEDVLGTSVYPVDPKEGATLEGLAIDAVTFGAPPLFHAFGFDPEWDDWIGTDQIYVGSTQMGSHDGYSEYGGRINGPQSIELDYSSIVPWDFTVDNLTLGIGADDFQFVPFGQPYTAWVNGTYADALTNVLNSLDQSGPVVQFFTIGLDPGWLNPSHMLWLEIDQSGDGGDGWAIDFLTVGVHTGGTVGAVERPVGFALAQNAPNPFNPTTTIHFSLPETGMISLKVFDLAGREVATLVEGMTARGGHSVVLDAGDLASGVYVYTLQTGSGTLSRKLVLMN